MLITDALLGEHGVFQLLLHHIEQALPALDSTPALQHELAAFAFALEAHARLEDELLFTALEPHLGTQGGPLAVMRMEHNQITDLLGRILEEMGNRLGHSLYSYHRHLSGCVHAIGEQVLFRM